MDHISFSQLNMLLKCGEQYRRRYVQGERIPPSAALIRGKCGHIAVEKNYLQKIDSRLDLPAEEVISAFTDGWEEGKFSIAWAEEDLQGESPKKAEGRYKDSGVALVGIYHKEQSPLVQPVSIEKNFTVEFHGDFPPLFGIMDRITEEGAVEEDKFVSKSPTEDDALTDVQLTAYSLGYQQTQGKPPARLVKRFAVDTKTPKTVVREAPAREPEQIDRFLRRLGSAMDAISKGVFLPAANGSWACNPRWCGYFSTCKIRP